MRNVGYDRLRCSRGREKHVGCTGVKKDDLDDLVLRPLTLLSHLDLSISAPCGSLPPRHVPCCDTQCKLERIITLCCYSTFASCSAARNLGTQVASTGTPPYLNIKLPDISAPPPEPLIHIV